MNIPLYQPLLDSAEEKHIADVLKKGVLTQDSTVRAFEQKFADVAGVNYVSAVSSGTSALHTALHALGVNPGDEVIVPAFTWVSTAYAVSYLGAKPVFCDIDPKTFNIDPQQLSGSISNRTVGIIPVHQFGLPADMDPILATAKAHGLWVLEDAACAVGALYKGQPVGSMGVIATFSFHPRKLITTGEGGAVVTSSETLHNRVQSIRQLDSPTFDTVGYNYRMSEIHAAVGVSQLEKWPDIQSRRMRQAQLYDELLVDCPGITPPAGVDQASHAYQSYVCMLDSGTALNRDRIIQELADRNITVRAGTHAPPLLPYYAHTYGYVPDDFPHAFTAARDSLALPLFHRMTQGQQRFVAAQLQAVVSSQKVAV